MSRNQENDFSASSKYYEVLLGKKRFEQSAAFIARILNRALRGPGRKCVLELGCGTGLYLRPLKKEGFLIDGLDISKRMLDEARKQSRGLHTFQQDMSKFSIPKRYDAILCLNSGLVLLPSFSAIQETIRRCAKHLVPGGVLILDIPNHQVEIRTNNLSQSHHAYTLKKGKADVIFRDFKKGNKWVSEWHGYAKEGKRFSTFLEHYEELIISPNRLESMLRREGFSIVSLHGSRRGGPFKPAKSFRRVYVCRYKD